MTHEGRHYVVCRHIALCWSAASQAIAASVPVSGFRRLLTRAQGLRTHCALDELLGRSSLLHPKAESELINLLFTGELLRRVPMVLVSTDHLGRPRFEARRFAL